MQSPVKRHLLFSSFSGCFLSSPPFRNFSLTVVLHWCIFSEQTVKQLYFWLACCDKVSCACYFSMPLVIKYCARWTSAPLISWQLVVADKVRWLYVGHTPAASVRSETPSNEWSSPFDCSWLIWSSFQRQNYSDKAHDHLPRHSLWIVINFPELLPSTMATYEYATKATFVQYINNQQSSRTVTDYLLDVNSVDSLRWWLHCMIIHTYIHEEYLYSAKEQKSHNAPQSQLQASPNKYVFSFCLKTGNVRLGRRRSAGSSCVQLQHITATIYSAHKIQHSTRLLTPLISFRNAKTVTCTLTTLTHMILKYTYNTVT